LHEESQQNPSTQRLFPHSAFARQGSPCNFAQRPAVEADALHDSPVAHSFAPQQTPSTQLPEAHSLDRAQAPPRLLRHVLVSSQIESPPQVSSVAFLMGEQVPTFPVRAQLSQDLSHARSQQIPSTQKPFGH
jgi:hypothetical protein